MPHWLKKGTKDCYLFFTITCWVWLGACTSIQHHNSDAQGLAWSQSADTGGLYLSWLWQISDPTSLQEKRLVISRVETANLHIVLFDRPIGAQILQLPIGTYHFHALIDDRFHPLSLTYIFPHKFHILPSKLSIVGSFEFQESADERALTIRQSAYFSHNEMTSLADLDLISAYSQQPLPYELIATYSQSACSGIHCPTSQFHRCFISEFGDHPIIYGDLTLTLKWSAQGYLIEQTRFHDELGSSLSPNLLNCVQQRAAVIPEAIYGDQFILRL